MNRLTITKENAERILNSTEFIALASEMLKFNFDKDRFLSQFKEKFLNSPTHTNTIIVSQLLANFLQCEVEIV